VKSDPLTLSQGRYQEFFPNDTLVQIGSVIFNTITQEVVGFVEPDSSGLNFPADVASRWLSPDPLAAKYPEMSPYVGMGNNPIIFVDPDGRYIFLVIGGETYRFTSEMINRTTTSDNVAQKAMSIAMRIPQQQAWESPIIKYLNDPGHDIYFVVTPTNDEHHGALPNASRFNKGEKGSFEFDKKAFWDYMTKHNPEATFDEERLANYEGLNGTDVSRSRGHFSMVYLNESQFSEDPAGSTVYLGPFTEATTDEGFKANREIASFDGALIIIHETGAHIDERNNPRNPGGVHNVSNESEWDEWNVDSFFKEFLEKVLDK
jgi:hypothetical protein